MNNGGATSAAWGPGVLGEVTFHSGLKCPFHLLLIELFHEVFHGFDGLDDLRWSGWSEVVWMVWGGLDDPDLMDYIEYEVFDGWLSFIL